MPGRRLGPIAILAGSGRLPVLLAGELRRLGRDHRVLAFRGFAEAALRARADAVVDLLDVRGALAWLDRWDPQAVTLAGAVQRPGMGAVFNAYALFRNRHELRALMAQGDDRLLRGVITFLEDHGHVVVGAHELAPELLARPGPYGRHAPTASLRQSIDIGLRLLEDLSSYDIGQAAVVSGERVVAVEGPEGTDRMLSRVRGLAQRWGIRTSLAGGVLVKTAKKGQDLRVDLPAIGPHTLVRAARAGLQGVAVGAGSTLVLDGARAAETADRVGLFLVGCEPAGAGARGLP